MLQGYSQAASAGAAIKHAPFTAGRILAENRLDKVFGFRARNQSGCGNIEAQAEEISAASNVGDRFTLSTATDHLFIAIAFYLLQRLRLFQIEIEPTA